MRFSLIRYLRISLSQLTPTVSAANTACTSSHHAVRVDDTCVRSRRNSARRCKMMELHVVYGRDARHVSRHATGHVLVKSLNRARHPPVSGGVNQTFLSEVSKISPCFRVSKSDKYISFVRIHNNTTLHALRSI